MARRPLALPLVFGVGMLVSATLAGAAGSERRFVLSRGKGAEDCPTIAEVHEQVVGHLGYDPFAPPTTAMGELHLHLVREGSGFFAQIELRDEHSVVVGRSALRSRAGSCAELSSAAAFAIAYALDPVHARERPSEEHARPSEPHEPHDRREQDRSESVADQPKQDRSESLADRRKQDRSESVADPSAVSREPRGLASTSDDVHAPSAIAKARRAADPLRLRFGLNALGAVGTVPEPTAAASASVGLGVGRWSVDIEGRNDLGATRELGDGATVRASLLQASLVPCAQRGVLQLCAIGSLGVLRGSSEGLVSSMQADSFWAAAGLRGGVVLPIVADRVKLRVFGELRAPMTRTALVVDDQPVWTTPPLTVALGVGAIALLP